MICGKRRWSQAEMPLRKSSFFRAREKRLSLAPDLIGIYFGYFFFLGKEKVSPTRDQTPCEP
jgi:hypothetical protein